MFDYSVGIGVYYTACFSYILALFSDTAFSLYKNLVFFFEICYTILTNLYLPLLQF